MSHNPLKESGENYYKQSRDNRVSYVDFSKLIEFYQQGVDEGNPSAMLKLADIYFEGKGVEVDLAKARQLYEKVINYCPNEAMVQKRLGIMYYEAIGGPKDLERAKEMLQSVADVHRADGKCYNYLGEMKYYGTVCRMDFVESKKFFKKAVGMGDVNAHYNLGMMYHFGQGGKPNATKSTKLYMKAVALGHEGVPYSLVTPVGPVYQPKSFCWGLCC